MNKITALTILLSTGCVVNTPTEDNIPRDSSITPFWITQDASIKTVKDVQPSDILNEDAVTLNDDGNSEGIGETSSLDLPDGSLDAIEEPTEETKDCSPEGSAEDVGSSDVESEETKDASQDSNNPEAPYDASEDIAETSPLEADGAIANEVSVGCSRGCALQGHYACWPIREHPTFNVVVNDFVVQDRCTGLYWESHITSNSNYYVFDDALHECTGRGLPIPQGVNAQWRLPTRLELASILDYDLGNPVLNTANVFAPTLDQFWTSSQTDTGLAWTITMHQGAIAAKAKTIAYYARCVLDPLGDVYQSDTLNHYDQSVEGEISDLATLLIWEAWDTQNSAARTLVDATTYCQTKGIGWRLPSLKELLTIGSAENIINPELFPNLIPGNYWTATTAYSSGGKHWTLHFGTGITSATEATAYVRCVR